MIPMIKLGNIMKFELFIVIATMPIITNSPPTLDSILPLLSFLLFAIFEYLISIVDVLLQ